MAEPYYADDSVTLWHGDCRELVPALGLQVDCVVADPPYGETALAWDRWPDGWPAVLADAGLMSMWCFGSMRMFLARAAEFAAWRLSQDLIWRKPNPTGFDADRFRRVHEIATHWYRGRWRDVHHAAQRVPYHGPGARHGYRGSNRTAHRGAVEPGEWTETGTRLMHSVLDVRGMWRRGAVHPTEKPVDLVRPLIEYACPPGGVVLDPFAGSGSTAAAARLSGRKAVLIEADERYCEVIARRLAQDVLPIGADG